MFARVTQYKMKPGSVEAAKKLMNDLKPQIMALEGLKSFTNAINEDGNGCVVSLVESREMSDANAAQVSALWAKFADHLEEPPTPNGYDVFVDWSN